MNFLFGIISGIATTIVLYIIRYLVGSIAVWFLKRSPRNISGMWKTEFWKGNVSITEVARIKQVRTWVWGTIEGQTDSGIRVYKLRGNLRENIFTAIYETESPIIAHFRGAFTLVLAVDGQSLDGQLALWTDIAKTPLTSQYIWKRIPRY